MQTHSFKSSKKNPAVIYQEPTKLFGHLETLSGLRIVWLLKKTTQGFTEATPSDWPLLLKCPKDDPIPPHERHYNNMCIFKPHVSCKIQLSPQMSLGMLDFIHRFFWMFKLSQRSFLPAPALFQLELPDVPQFKRRSILVIHHVPYVI